MQPGVNSRQDVAPARLVAARDLLLILIRFDLSCPRRRHLALGVQRRTRHIQAHSVDDLLLRHFGLRENPFGVTPDPRFLFMSRTHREALASLVNGIACGFGFQVLVAQPGMGKTTLLFDFLERFNSSRTAFLFQQQHDSREFLQSLLIGKGVNPKKPVTRNCTVG